MNASASSGTAAEGTTPAGRAPHDAMRLGLEALSAALRLHFRHTNELLPLRLSPETRDRWLAGVRRVLAENRLVSLAVSPLVIQLGEHPVLDGNERALAESLHKAGARGITIFEGVPDEELLMLAELLVTRWDGGAPGQDFPAAIWEARLPHVWFDLSTFGAEPLASPALPLAAAAALGRAPTSPRPSGSLTPAAAAILHDLKRTLAPDASATYDPVAPAGTIPPEIAAEVALQRWGADIDADILGSALVAALVAADSPERARAAAEGLIGASIDLLGGPADVSALLHHLLECCDAEFGGSEAIRLAAHEAVRAVVLPPMAARLASRLPPVDGGELAGPLFSLFSLLSAQEDARALAKLLPRWAVGVLADTLVLREIESGRPPADTARVHVVSEDRAERLLGLAMAGRLDDPRLVEAVLVAGRHPDAATREAALFALRQQSLPRVRELAIERLKDNAAGVRLEAMRYAVAHRLSELIPRIEERLTDPALDADEAELRALCVAYGKLAKDDGLLLLQDLASGRKRSAAPKLPRLALFGLSAIGSPAARAAIANVAANHPHLRDEAHALVGRERA